MSELYLAGNTILDVTVPAAVAAAMGKMTPQESPPEAKAVGLRKRSLGG